MIIIGTLTTVITATNVQLVPDEIKAQVPPMFTLPDRNSLFPPPVFRLIDRSQLFPYSPVLTLPDKNQLYIPVQPYTRSYREIQLQRGQIIKWPPVPVIIWKPPVTEPVSPIVIRPRQIIGGSVQQLIVRGPIYQISVIGGPIKNPFISEPIKVPIVVPLDGS